MKRITILLTLVFVFIMVSANLVFAADNGLRYTVSVSKFENKSNWRGQWDLGDAWGEVMTEILNRSGKFIVLGESDMRQEALNEQNMTGGNKKIMPAQLLVKGAITNVQTTSAQGGGINIGGVRLGGAGGETELNATIYIVETATGRVVASKSVTGKSRKGGVSVSISGAHYANASKDNTQKALEDAIDQGVKWMTEQLPKITWRGNIVAMDGENAYINRGEREGVKVGQTFVVGSTKVLRDPETNEVLDEIVNESGRIQVISVKEKVAICNVISGSVSKGMRIQLP